MQESRKFPLRREVLWVLVVLTGVVAIGAIGFDISRRSTGMRAATTTAASVLAARPGASVSVVVRLEGLAAPNTYAAELLESSSGTKYRETNTRIRVALSANTAVAMGGAADIKAGTVVQAAGAMDAARTLHASQIVILSGYVHVEPVP